MTQLCSNASLFEAFKASVEALQQTATKHTRAHQTLPRYRRRRAMSYNFYRLPQFLRPRALRETGSSGLIFAKNAPRPSRKHLRLRRIPALHRFLARRMKYFAGVPFRGCEKCLRRAQQACVIPRTDGYALYSVGARLPQLLRERAVLDGAIDLLGAASGEGTTENSGVASTAHRLFFHSGNPIEVFNIEEELFALVYTTFGPEFETFCASEALECSKSQMVHFAVYGAAEALTRCVRTCESPDSDPFEGDNETVVVKQMSNVLLHNIQHIELESYGKSVEECIAGIEGQRFQAEIVQKFIRCQRPKRIYSQSREYEANKHSDLTPFDFAAVREESFTFVFAAPDKAHALIKKLFIAGIPLAGVLERRFLQFESRYVDLAVFSGTKGANGRSIYSNIEKEVGRTHIHHLKPKTTSREREEMFIKWLMTDLEEWAEVKAGILARKKEGSAEETVVKIPNLELVAGFGFEDAQKGTEYIDKCYSLRAGREIGMKEGGVSRGVLI